MSLRVQQDCGYTVPDRTRTAPVQGVRRELGRQAEIERLENLRANLRQQSCAIWSSQVRLDRIRASPFSVDAGD